MSVAVNSLRNLCSEELQAEIYFPENYLHGTGIFVPGRDGLFGKPGRVHLDTPTTTLEAGWHVAEITSSVNLLVRTLSSDVIGSHDISCLRC